MHALTTKREAVSCRGRTQGRHLGVFLMSTASKGLPSQFIVSGFGLPYCKMN